MAALLYLLAAVVTQYFAIEDAPFSAGADVGAYIGQAVALAEEGRFANGSGNELATFHTPLYPAFIAVNMWAFGKTAGAYAAIYEQLVLLFLTGLMVSAIVARTHESLALPALYLTIFNPNSFSSAHGTQTETLFTFLLTAGLFLFFEYTRRRKWWLLPVIGVVIAASAYCRPAGQYFGLLVPLAAALYATRDADSLKDGALRAMREFVRSSIVVVVVAAAMIPWLQRNHGIVGEYVFSTNIGLYLRDNVIYIYTKTSGEPVNAMARRFERRFDQYLAESGSPERKDLNPQQESRELTAFSMKEFWQQPASAIARSAVQSIVFLYATGGTGTLKELWGLNNSGLYEIEYREGDGSIFGSAITFLQRIKPHYLLLVGIGIAYACVMRLLGLAGLYALARSPHWRDLVIYVGILAFFTAMYLFLGQPRFRAPLEPVLVILAIWGLATVCGPIRRSELARFIRRADDQNRK